MKRIVPLILALLLLLALSAPAFAAEQAMTFEEAKEYLNNFNVTKNNQFGKSYTISYVFKSESDLNSAAEYIVNNGLSSFNSALDSAIAEAVSNEPQQTIPTSRSISPTVVYKNISGNGRHRVSGEAYGLASFDTLGSLEYRVELGYQVTVTGGKITNISSISFDVPYIGASGSWGNISFPSQYTDYSCSVTANYTITKSVTVGVGDFSVEVKSETDYEGFPLVANLV